MKIISSRYERRRERDPESEERTRRSVSPGPPRKKSRTDVDPSSSHSAYQRPRSPSPRPHLPPPRYPAASYHQPPQTPTPSARSHQDDRHKPSPRLSRTSQSSFSAPPPAHTDTKDSQNHTSTSTAPLKISSFLATLSSSTALSSMLSRTDGVEHPPRTKRSTSQSSVPPSASVLGMSAAQFDLAKLQSLSQALQNHGTVSTASTDGNSNHHIPKPTVVPNEPRSTHPIAAERSSSSLVCCLILRFMWLAVDCLRWRRFLNLTGSIPARMCKMKEDLTNDGVQRAPARVKGCNMAVAIGKTTLDPLRIALILGTEGRRVSLVNAQGPLRQQSERPRM